MTLSKKARESAISEIESELERSTDGALRSMLCAAVGHPPVVRSYLGQITCARCDEILGDTLMGATSLKERAVVGHDCNECRAVCKSLRPVQRLLLLKEAADFVKKMRARPARKGGRS